MDELSLFQRIGMLIFLFPPLSVTYLFLHSLWDRKGKRTDYLWCLLGALLSLCFALFLTYIVATAPTSDCGVDFWARILLLLTLMPPAHVGHRWYDELRKGFVNLRLQNWRKVMLHAAGLLCCLVAMFGLSYLPFQQWLGHLC